MPEHGWYNIYLYEILIGGTVSETKYGEALCRGAA